MRILFIAPIAPPVDGQSKASTLLLNKLYEKCNDISVVSLNKKVFRNNSLNITRIYEIIKVLYKVNRLKHNNDLIYISIAESFFGNIRDLLIYTLCYKYRSKIVIHMLGGAGMKKIIGSNKIFYRLNKFFIKDFLAVLVEGTHNVPIFTQLISRKKIHIVPNFADDFLISTNEEIEGKLDNINIINILYLSNLLPGKGYEELIDGFSLLDPLIRENFKLTFVGSFESSYAEKLFMEKIQGFENVKYLGRFVDGIDKRDLYLNSHIFCLPTYYPYEGQPISILEAYATGCVVITTNHSGIPYIFKDGINGFFVEPKSKYAIKDLLTELLNKKGLFLEIALNNRNEVIEKYRTTIYLSNIENILNTR